MSKTVPNGLFVVFEGVEGSGKTTQSEALKRALSGAGYEAILTVEPGGTPTGDYVRRWLKSGTGITPLAELFLFSAARAALVESVIAPAMEKGMVVVCDRYIYSTVAYQGHGRGLDLKTIAELNHTATGGLSPRLVVLLDLPADQGAGRKASHALDRIERESLSFHRRVRHGYLEQARQDPDRWLVLDAAKPVADITRALWERVASILLEA